MRSGTSSIVWVGTYRFVQVHVFVIYVLWVAPGGGRHERAIAHRKNLRTRKGLNPVNWKVLLVLVYG